ncbi:CPBP family intramembrane glutamic endopeptidase [Chitinophaga arvensicola]|nr:CPBP family intramembrane glutamic endopeptidase [Chitinophaga arvensicola]
MGVGFLLNSLGRDPGGYQSEHKNMAESIAVAILLAPPLETLISQMIPYLIIDLFKERLQQWFMHCYIIVSALFFAFAHTYSNGYVLAMYVPGIVLAYSYARSKQQHRPAFLTTMLIHLLYNTLVLAWNYFLADA